MSDWIQDFKAGLETDWKLQQLDIDGMLLDTASDPGQTHRKAKKVGFRPLEDYLRAQADLEPRAQHTVGALHKLVFFSGVSQSSRTACSIRHQEDFNIPKPHIPVLQNGILMSAEFPG